MSPIAPFLVLEIAVASHFPCAEQSRKPNKIRYYFSPEKSSIRRFRYLVSRIYIYIGDRGFPVTIGIRRYLRESSR